MAGRAQLKFVVTECSKTQIRLTGLICILGRLFIMLTFSYRCAKYSSLPAGCTLVADPSDPLCCEAPQCTPQMNSSVPYPTPPLGHKTGGYVTPAPTLKPGVSPSPGQTMAPPLLQGRGKCLTHICLVDPSILINWTSPFPILRVSGVPFHFYSVLSRYSC